MTSLSNSTMRALALAAAALGFLGVGAAGQTSPGPFTADQASLHGLEFTSYTDKSMDQRQCDWLTGFVQAQGEPTVEIVASANGFHADDM